ncbi:Uncharacterized protein HZ326_26387 [Fusarium oxysporum f. sp. albedinis]|nr:Uncharacterized protein HZ326_26387 [Fusarium oxysporum f. sp. albedinis]
MGKEPRGDIILRHLLYEIVISADRSFCSDKLKTSLVRQSGLELQKIISPMKSSRDATCRVTMSDDRDLVTLRDPSHKKVARLRK